MLKTRTVGKIKDAHGLRGDLYVLIFSKDVSWAPKLKVFYLRDSETDSHPQAFEVEKFKPFKDGLMLKARSIPDRTEAEKLKGKLFSIPEELLESEKGETIYLSEIEGFEVINPEGLSQGRIVGFSSNRAQDLLLVDKADGGRAEIPFVEAFIVKIDFEAHTVRMNLPEGIWDLQAL